MGGHRMAQFHRSVATSGRVAACLWRPCGSRQERLVMAWIAHASFAPTRQAYECVDDPRVRLIGFAPNISGQNRGCGAGRFPPCGIAGIWARCPWLGAVAYNGGESVRHHAAAQAALHGVRGPCRAVSGSRVESIKLSSTSPAIAAVSFARRFAAGKECQMRHGMV